MKLKLFFDSLKQTAFGPWLAKYKSFFTNEELETEKAIVQAELDKIDKDTQIVIMSNDVIKLPKNQELPENFINRITNHNIQKVLTAISNIQLNEFAKFIMNLPNDWQEYKKYFNKVSLKDSYSKIQAFKEVVDIDGLVNEFQNSPNEDYRSYYPAVRDGVQHLQEYILTGQGSENYNE